MNIKFGNFKNALRQGDVLLAPVLKTPEGGKVSEHKEYTVAHGEATGHHHTLYGSIPNAIVVHDFDEVKFFKINEGLSFKHQEHGRLEVKALDYVQINEREYDYFEKVFKKVID